MQKKQTAMQELLSWVRETLPMDLDFPQMIENKIEQALQIERDQIEEAYMQGDEDGFNSTESKYDYEAEGRSKYLAEQYYTQKFGK
jgi:hypothetical protein